MQWPVVVLHTRLLRDFNKLQINTSCYRVTRDRSLSQYTYLDRFVSLEDKFENGFDGVGNAVDDHVGASLFEVGFAGKTCNRTHMTRTAYACGERITTVPCPSVCPSVPGAARAAAANRGVGTAGATGALTPAMLKPRGREYLFAPPPQYIPTFSHDVP